MINCDSEAHKIKLVFILSIAWDVKCQGVTAEKGLWLIAKVRNTTVKIEILPGPALRFKVTLPAMHWCNNHLIATLKEDDDSIGPQLEIEYDGGKFKSGSIKGFISTFGLSGNYEILITPEEGNNFKYTSSLEGKLFQEIPAKLSVEAFSDSPDIGTLDFKVGSLQSRNKAYF